MHVLFIDPMNIFSYGTGLSLAWGKAKETLFDTVGAVALQHTSITELLEH